MRQHVSEKLQRREVRAGVGICAQILPVHRKHDRSEIHPELELLLQTLFFVQQLSQLNVVGICQAQTVKLRIGGTSQVTELAWSGNGAFFGNKKGRDARPHARNSVCVSLQLLASSSRWFEKQFSSTWKLDGQMRNAASLGQAKRGRGQRLSILLETPAGMERVSQRQQVVKQAA